MTGDTQADVETLNDYSFAVTPTDIERPNNLYTESQFRQAIEAIVPDEADVVVSSRMTRRVAEVEKHRVHGTVSEVKVSYRIFDDEENRYSAGNGWEVVVSCLADLGGLAE